MAGSTSWISSLPSPWQLLGLHFLALLLSVKGLQGFRGSFKRINKGFFKGISKGSFKGICKGSFKGILWGLCRAIGASKGYHQGSKRVLYKGYYTIRVLHKGYCTGSIVVSGPTQRDPNVGNYLCRV